MIHFIYPGNGTRRGRGRPEMKNEIEIRNSAGRLTVVLAPRKIRGRTVWYIKGEDRNLYFTSVVTATEILAERRPPID